MATSFAFELLGRSGGARRGRMTTAHGIVETPAFMPVGTQAAVKGITLAQLEDLGADIVLGNTYHLHVRPGEALIARAGGLHRFMGWTRPILTDSGGFQVFSLADRRTVTDEGVTFRSHLDGRLLTLTPESAADIQVRLGADIAMVLDECVSAPASREQVAAAMRRSLAWARRARERFLTIMSGRAGVEVTNSRQVQFGIIQGGIHRDLRDESVAGTVSVGFEAYAIGGLSVGESSEALYDITAHTAARLPEDRPRYLMGVGTPVDVVNAVARGVDLFDCVLPTRNARNGQLLTRQGPLAIKNARYAEDERPPDSACGCPTCRRHSRAYLRHLYLAGEMAAAALNTVHNLHFYLDMMRDIRKAIASGRFDEFARAFLGAYACRRPDVRES